MVITSVAFVWYILFSLFSSFVTYSVGMAKNTWHSLEIKHLGFGEMSYCKRQLISVMGNTSLSSFIFRTD